MPKNVTVRYSTQQAVYSYSWWRRSSNKCHLQENYSDINLLTENRRQENLMAPMVTHRNKNFIPFRGSPPTFRDEAVKGSITFLKSRVSSRTELPTLPRWITNEWGARFSSSGSSVFAWTLFFALRPWNKSNTNWTLSACWMHRQAHCDYLANYVVLSESETWVLTLAEKRNWSCLKTRHFTDLLK